MVLLTNLLKKRRNTVLNIGFQIDEKCELPKGKRKTESWECDWDYSNLGILRASIVPYISLSKKLCKKVIIFHSFESEWFCPSLCCVVLPQAHGANYSKQRQVRVKICRELGSTTETTLAVQSRSQEFRLKEN